MAIKRLKRTAGGDMVTGPQIIDQLTDSEVLLLNQSADAAVLRWYMKALSTNRLIDLDAPETGDGITALVTAGILTQVRANAIVAALRTAA